MLILASKSTSRARLLTQAGISHSLCASGVDESIIKKDYGQNKKSAAQTALALATEKAKAVAQKFPQAYVLGADQMVECEGRWIDKAESMEEARDQLLFLRGKSHTLPTSAVIIHQDQVVWHHTAIPHLTMRSYSTDFVDNYLRKMDSDVLTAVGCYQIEKLGAQLFEQIKGDIFTIMGLPLLPLLEYLRQIGLVES